ncbi:MAG: caspase family protein, partial [Chromatocurvus sp.]
AADQGDITALRRLAYMHENGLGVTRDPLLAANLWRRATGLGEDLVLASEVEAARTAAEQRVEKLTRQLHARNAETDALRLELSEAREGLAARRADMLAESREVVALQEALAEARREEQATAASGRIRELEQALRERQQRLEDQQFQLESLEATLDARNAGLAASVRQVELENRRLQSELERVSAMSELELADARRALAERDADVVRLRNEQAELSATVAQERQNLALLDARLETLRTAAGDSERAREQARQLAAQREQQAQLLAASQGQVKALRGALAGKQSEAEALRGQLDTALDERQQAEAKLAQTESEMVTLRQREAAAMQEQASLQTEVALARAERDQLAAAVAANAGNAASGAELKRLRQELAQRNAELAEREARLTTANATARRYRNEVAELREQWQLQVATRSVLDPLPDTSRIRIPAEIQLGTSYALVIGNNNYAHLRKLRFAHNDARAVHEVLTQRYRFQSELLLDATRGDIFRRVDALKDTLKPQDSLLIYYAGHGSEDGTNSYWMGVDATSASPGAQEMFGVSSSALARWLTMLPANHVLVIADSCYSGRGIVTSGGIKLRQEEIQKNMKFYLQNRARTVLTSGGVVPVPDGGAGDHSVFTKALVGLLNQNNGVLFDNDLYAHLKDRIRQSTDASMAVPDPIFGRIEINNGHGSGQFAFLHPNLISR